MARRKSKRDKYRKALGSKTQESYERRGQSGSFKTFFDSNKMEGIKTWWASKGEHIIDIIPYEAGNNDPRNEPGEPTYVLDIEVHRMVGPTEEMIVCPEQFGDPCPICIEARKRNREGADWKKEIKPLKPSRRVVYNIIVRDGDKEEKKGVQVFEIAHFFMENHLSKLAKDPRGGGFIVFSDPDDGKSIAFEREGVGPNDTRYSGHKLIDRLEPISDEELEQAYCLDDLIKMRTYDEIYEIFHGKSDAGESSDGSDGSDGSDDSKTTTSNTKSSKKDKKFKKFKKLKCPAGGTIGKSIEEFDECDKCSIYSKCEYVADRL